MIRYLKNIFLRKFEFSDHDMINLIIISTVDYFCDEREFEILR